MICSRHRSTILDVSLPSFTDKAQPLTWLSSTILSEASNSETFLPLDSGSFPNCDDEEGLFAQYLRSPTSSVIGDDDKKENTAVVSKISPEIS